MISTVRIIRQQEDYYGCYLSEKETYGGYGDRPYNVYKWRNDLWVAHDEGVQGFRLPTWMTMM